MSGVIVGRSQVHRRPLSSPQSWEAAPAYDVRGELQATVEALGDLRVALDVDPLTSEVPLTIQLRALQHVMRAWATYRNETGDDDE